MGFYVLEFIFYDTEVTVPLPTVLLPSLIANLSPSFIAIGDSKVTFKFTVSPGIAIPSPGCLSTNSRDSAVTSVVIK